MKIGQPCIHYTFTGSLVTGTPNIWRVTTNPNTGAVKHWGTYFCKFLLAGSLTQGSSYSCKAKLIDTSGSTDLWVYRHEGRNLYTWFGEQVSQGNYPAGPPWYYVNPFRLKSGTAEDSPPGGTKRSPARSWQLRPEPYYFMVTINKGQRMEIDIKEWIEDAYVRDGLSNPPHLSDTQPSGMNEAKDDEVQVAMSGLTTADLWMVRI